MESVLGPRQSATRREYVGTLDRTRIIGDLRNVLVVLRGENETLIDTVVPGAGFLPNARQHRAFALATLHVAQLARTQWADADAAPDWRALYDAAVPFFTTLRTHTRARRPRSLCLALELVRREREREELEEDEEEARDTLSLSLSLRLEMERDGEGACAKAKERAGAVAARIGAERRRLVDRPTRAARVRTSGASRLARKSASSLNEIPLEARQRGQCAKREGQRATVVRQRKFKTGEMKEKKRSFAEGFGLQTPLVSGQLEVVRYFPRASPSSLLLSLFGAKEFERGASPSLSDGCFFSSVFQNLISPPQNVPIYSKTRVSSRETRRAFRGEKITPKIREFPGV